MNIYESLNKGFDKKYLKEEFDIVTKEVLKFLDNKGYDISIKEVQNFADAVAEYVDMVRSVEGKYDLEDWYKDTKLNYPEEFDGLPLKEDIEEKEIFHNDNGIDYVVVERSRSGRNALLNKGKQWIVAWECPMDSGSWGQGHYFFDEKDARKVWENKYINEDLDIKDYSNFMNDLYNAISDVVFEYTAKFGDLSKEQVESALETIKYRFLQD